MLLTRPEHMDIGLVYGDRGCGPKVESLHDFDFSCCPSGAEIWAMRIAIWESLPGVESADSNLVWTPFCTPEKIEPRVRAYLGFRCVIRGCLFRLELVVCDSVLLWLAPDLTGIAVSRARSFHELLPHLAYLPAPHPGTSRDPSRAGLSRRIASSRSRRAQHTGIKGLA